MRQKAIVATAVAGAFAWPLAVSANSWDTGSATRDDATKAQTHHRSFMRYSEPVNRSDVGVWEVATPYSPNETGVASPPQSYSAQTAEDEPAMSFEAAQAEVVTPFSPNETGPVAMERERRAPNTVAMARSLPNPQTPPSPNEVDPSRPVDDTVAHREQVAGIEEAHAAVASAAGSTAGPYDDRSLVRSEPPSPNEPAGVIEERQPAVRNDVMTNDVTATAPAEPATPGRNEVDVTPNQPALVQSRDSLGVASREQYGSEPESPEAASGPQTAPIAPESGVAATPATPPSQNAAEQSDSGGQRSVRTTM